MNKYTLENRLAIIRYVLSKAVALECDGDYTHHQYVCGLGDGYDPKEFKQLANGIMESYHKHLTKLEEYIEELSQLVSACDYE